MSIRPALPASLILAVLAATAVSVGGAAAAEECLARPKGAAPAGKHWYYSTNRAMKRKCWFLADAGAATARPQKRVPVAAIPEDQDIGRSADARAELVDAPVEPSTKAIETPRLEVVESEPDRAQPRDWVVAARWPTVSETLVDNRPMTLAVARSDDVPAPVPSAATSVREAARASAVPFAAAIFLVVIGGAIAMAFASRRHSAAPSQAARSA